MPEYVPFARNIRDNPSNEGKTIIEQPQGAHGYRSSIKSSGDTVTNTPNTHDGVEFDYGFYGHADALHDAVIAPFRARIIAVSGSLADNTETTGLGNYITIQRLDDTGNAVKDYMTFAHLSTNGTSGISVKKGQEVIAGQVLGVLGDTGFSGGPHYHIQRGESLEQGKYAADTTNIAERWQGYESSDEYVGTATVAEGKIKQVFTPLTINGEGRLDVSSVKDFSSYTGDYSKMPTFIHAGDSTNLSTSKHILNILEYNDTDTIRLQLGTDFNGKSFEISVWQDGDSFMAPIHDVQVELIRDGQVVGTYNGTISSSTNEKFIFTMVLMQSTSSVFPQQTPITQGHTVHPSGFLMEQVQ